MFDHLLGTRRLLVEWEARPALCDAGLFHSVYSTEYYELKAIPLSMRDEVRQLIGDEAESRTPDIEGCENVRFSGYRVSRMA